MIILIILLLVVQHGWSTASYGVMARARHAAAHCTLWCVTGLGAVVHAQPILDAAMHDSALPHGAAEQASNIRVSFRMRSGTMRYCYFTGITVLSDALPVPCTQTQANTICCSDHVMPCEAMQDNAIQCHAMLHQGYAKLMQFYARLCNAMRRDALPCHARCQRVAMYARLHHTIPQGPDPVESRGFKHRGSLAGSWDYVAV